MTSWNGYLDDPASPGQVLLLERAVDAADAARDLDRGFHARLELVAAARRSGRAREAVAAFARCRALADADPVRFADHEVRLNWMMKWMPGWALDFPDVDLATVAGLVDDLEVRHRRLGAGDRQALALRLVIARDTGVGADLAVLLDAWRRADRSSLADCPSCEAGLEAAVRRRLGDDAGALAALEPYLRRDAVFCDNGPGGLLADAIEPLVHAGRADDARDAFHRSLPLPSWDRGCAGRLPLLAALAARTGNADLAEQLLTSSIGVLDLASTPEDLRLAAVRFARAAAALDPAVPVERAASVRAVGQPGDRPGWTVGRLGDRLGSVALDLAARFDARNGTGLVGARTQHDLTAPDLPALDLHDDRP